jgi:hypothetical protein
MASLSFRHYLIFDATEKRRMSQAMAVACGSVGGQAALARAIGRPEETISDWANGKSPVDPRLSSRSSALPGYRHVPRSRQDLWSDVAALRCLPTLWAAEASGAS